MMQHPVRHAALVAFATLWAASASASSTATQVVGPLNKSQSGRIVCDVVNDFFAVPTTIVIYDKNGIVAATASFDLSRKGTAEVGPGAAGSFFCAVSAGTFFSTMVVSLTHVNSLGQATASVSDSGNPDNAGPTAVAGPLGPGLAHYIVCKATSHAAQDVDLWITNKAGTTVASATRAAQKYGTVEIAIIARYGEFYVCHAAGDTSAGIWATAEGRSTLGIPTSAVSGVVLGRDD